MEYSGRSTEVNIGTNHNPEPCRFSACCIDSQKVFCYYLTNY